MKRVMAVDDERPIIEGMALMIARELGTEFTLVGSASSGREALERVPDLAPDIVLMDVSMPGISGLETIRELRRRGSKAAFILVTAYERFDIARNAVELGLAGYLLKPVTREELARTLRTVASTLDREREAENLALELREREERLLPFVQSALLRGLMQGGSGREAEAALERLGVDEPAAIALAFAFTAPCGEANPAASVEALHTRLRDGLRYRSKALAGPLVSMRCLLALPCRDGPDSVQRLAEVQEVVSRSLGAEMAQGLVRHASGPLRPWAEFHHSWAEALAALALGPDHASGGAADSAPLPGSPIPAPGTSDYPPSGQGSFEEDEEFLHTLLDGNEGRATLCLDRILASLGRNGTVSPSEAGRFAILLGTAARQLAQRGLLEVPELERLLDLRPLSGGGETGSWKLTATALFGSLLSVLSREARHSPAVTKALAYIKENYQHQIGLESTADRIGLSPARLSRLLVDETGRGFSDLLIERRIERAKELLLEGGATIKDVSYSTGYPDPNYFARLFKKVTGYTPSDWASGRQPESPVEG